MRRARGTRRPPPRRLSVLLLCCIAWSGCGPSDPIQDIQQRFAKGDFEGSLEPLRELLAERKGDAQVQYLYGLALSQLGQTSLAEWSLREAMNDPAWLVPAGTRLTHGALTTRNYSLAVETATRVLESAPENVDVLVMRGNAHAHGRLDPEAALADAERVLEIDPENIDAMEPKILALLALERIDEAASAIEELGRKIETGDVGPGMPGWHCATAALFAEESDEDELAAERWADCVERFPEHPNVVTNGVHYYDAHGDHDRALEILRRGQAENPDSRDFRIILAARLRAVGAPEEAESLLREPTGSEHAVIAAAAWLDLAKHFQELERYAASAEAAEQAYTRISETGEPNPQLAFEYADALLMAGEHARALQVADEMTVSAHQWLIRARVAQEEGRYEEALAHYDEAFQLWPDNVHARYLAALAAESSGRFDQAVELYRYAIRIDPGATDARVRVAQLHHAEGRAAEALHLLRLKAEEAPLGFEGELLSLELMARLGRRERMLEGIQGFARLAPDRLDDAIARAALGVERRGGPAAALHFVREAKAVGLDLAHPRHAEALRALVRFAHRAGQLGEAEDAVKAARVAHPDASVFHEIHGHLLELSGAPPAEARAAYERAVKLDAANWAAVNGLARLAEDPERSLALYEQVLATRPADVEARRGAADALLRAGRAEEAEQRLEALLRERVYDAQTAAQLAELDLARDAASDRTLLMANRAVRFGGGPEALELLSRVHEKRGDEAAASRAAERASQLRERRGG